jgi:hypothetical protein
MTARMTGPGAAGDTSELRVRRARRADLEPVRALLGRGAPVRADRHQFRRLVSTLREDLYLVERAHDLTLVGLAVIAYIRGIGARTAVVRELHGPPAASRLLLECAHARAQARGCSRLELNLGPTDEATALWLDDLGWRPSGRVLVRDVDA